MKNGTIYHRLSHAIQGEVSTTDESNFDSFRNSEVSVYEGLLDAETEYPIDDFTSGIRTMVSGITISAMTVMVGNYITISNLPDPCWISADGGLLEVTGGQVIRAFNKARKLPIELVGEYKSQTAVITIKSSIAYSRDSDIRWQQLENATPTQINTWIDNNITTLASAKELLKTLTLAIRVLHDKNK